MASSLGAVPSNFAEQIRALQEQIEIAVAKEKEVQQAVTNFARSHQGEHTPEQAQQFSELLTTAQSACVCAANLRDRVSAAQRACYNLNNSGLSQGEGSPSLKDRQVVPLDLTQVPPQDNEEPLGYYPG